MDFYRPMPDKAVMEFHIDTAGMSFRLDEAQDTLLAEDPGSVMDLTGTQLRVSTFLPATSVVERTRSREVPVASATPETHRLQTSVGAVVALPGRSHMCAPHTVTDEVDDVLGAARRTGPGLVVSGSRGSRLDRVDVFGEVGGEVGDVGLAERRMVRVAPTKRVLRVAVSGIRVVALTVAVVVIINLAMDFVQAWLNPKVRAR